MMHTKEPNFDTIAQCVGLKRCDPLVVSVLNALKLLDFPVRSIFEETNSEDLSFREIGICFDFEKEILTSIFFMSNQKESEYVTYSGRFPYDLNWNSSVSDVTKAINMKPNGRGDYVYHKFLGYLNPWVRYDLGSYSLHFEFTADGKNIQMVTVSSLGCSSPNS